MWDLNDYIKTWCDLTDVLTTCRFALLVKSLQWNRKIQCGSYCRQMLTFFELFGVAFLFIWFGNGVHTPLLLALHSSTWPFQPVMFKWRQNSPSTGFASWSSIDTTWMHCATLGPVMLINRKFDMSFKLQAWHIVYPKYFCESIALIEVRKPLKKIKQTFVSDAFKNVKFIGNHRYFLC